MKASTSIGIIALIINSVLLSQAITQGKPNWSLWFIILIIGSIRAIMYNEAQK